MVLDEGKGGVLIIGTADDGDNGPPTNLDVLVHGIGEAPAHDLLGEGGPRTDGLPERCRARVVRPEVHAHARLGVGDLPTWGEGGGG
jgi:hypothetical protein